MNKCAGRLRQCRFCLLSLALFMVCGPSPDRHHRRASGAIELGIPADERGRTLTTGHRRRSRRVSSEVRSGQYCYHQQIWNGDWRRNAGKPRLPARPEQLSEALRSPVTLGSLTSIKVTSQDGLSSITYGSSEQFVAMEPRTDSRSISPDSVTWSTNPSPPSVSIDPKSGLLTTTGRGQQPLSS